MPEPAPKFTPKDGAQSESPRTAARLAPDGVENRPGRAAPSPLLEVDGDGAAPKPAESDPAGTERQQTAKYSPKHRSAAPGPFLAFLQRHFGAES